MPIPLTPTQIAEAFCRHRFAETYAYIADDIRWNNVGAEKLIGREAVIHRCVESAKYLETVTTTFFKLEIHRAENCVIVESAAQYQDGNDQISSVASCDIFHFSEGRLIEISSYVFDRNQP